MTSTSHFLFFFLQLKKNSEEISDLSSMWGKFFPPLTFMVKTGKFFQTLRLFSQKKGFDADLPLRNKINKIILIIFWIYVFDLHFFYWAFPQEISMKKVNVKK